MKTDTENRMAKPKAYGATSTTKLLPDKVFSGTPKDE